MAEALRLLREREAATREILQVICDSRSDEKPVFDAILRNAGRLCDAPLALLLLLDGSRSKLELVAHSGTRSGFVDVLQKSPLPLDASLSEIARSVVEESVIHLPDIREGRLYRDGQLHRVQAVEVEGIRTLLIVPLLGEGRSIGAIALYRREVSPFEETEIELLQTFAVQAVIAIENVRQNKELELRNRDLSEALDRQRATGEVLNVISRSQSDALPVFEAIARSSALLCGARLAVVLTLKNGLLQFSAEFGLTNEAVDAQRRAFPMKPDQGTVAGRAVLNRSLAQIADVKTDADYRLGDLADLMGIRSVIAVPMLHDGEPLGTITVLRADVGYLPERQIEMLETFADQAVIAIENSRLFTELEERNDDLTEALERQTATSKVLGVISRSTLDLQPVLDTIVETAAHLCHAEWAVIHRLGDDGAYHLAADARGGEAMLRYLAQNPVTPGRGKIIGRTVLEAKIVHVEDVLEDPEYEWSDAQQKGGYRTVLGVPLLREGVVIGVIALARNEVKPLTESEIDLVATFADQAVIAIENARLLSELRTSLEQQTATSNVLTAISRSTFDLPTVLTTLVEAAARLCEADHGTIAREQSGAFRRVASHGYSAQFDENVINLPVELGRGSATGRALSEGQIVHIPDVEEDSEYTFTSAKNLGGFRTVLAVPLLREGTAIGILALSRKAPRPFNEKQIDLVKTFADQAAIAIENVRLFERAEARARELAESLDELRVAQDRLVQTEKLASLGQLTAGIAHEIKNPLNFVTNFASLSTELVDELEEGLSALSLPDDEREDIDDIARLLRTNLEKIQEHGYRADSIVKNMLQHARQGTGERRLVKINALVEESLNLAFHGARAERPGFEITLNRSFDDAAGEVDLYPQEITRVLLNLLSNSFYATSQRKDAETGVDYEPTVSVTTRGDGDMVEITIHDNGTGIPPDVKARLFSPFFTTKPAGAGTGLGLSISHDIIAKQHAGGIEVETQPGEFTEFRIQLPRAMANPAAPPP